MNDSVWLRFRLALRHKIVARVFTYDDRFIVFISLFSIIYIWMVVKEPNLQRDVHEYVIHISSDV